LKFHGSPIFSAKQNIAADRNPESLSTARAQNFRALYGSVRKTCRISPDEDYFRMGLEPSLCKHHFPYIPHNVPEAPRASRSRRIIHAISSIDSATCRLDKRFEPL
jgi:hypothetical protein